MALLESLDTPNQATISKLDMANSMWPIVITSVFCKEIANDINPRLLVSKGEGQLPPH